MYRSYGQLIDPQGSQGEQIQHTNFGQAGELPDVFRLRGGYSEGWTVFWITAHFLNAAVQFDAMGVDLDRVDTFTAKAALSAGSALESLPDEPKVRILTLWEGQSKPYYKENTLVEREEKVWGTLCITNVTEPTLTIYPAKTNNAGVGVVIIPTASDKVGDKGSNLKL